MAVVSKIEPFLSGSISPLLTAKITPLISAKINSVLRGVAASIVLGGVGVVSWAVSPASAAPAATPRATAVNTSGSVLTDATQQAGNVEDGSGNDDSATAVPKPSLTAPNRPPIAPAPIPAAPAPIPAAPTLDPTAPSPQPSGSTPPASLSVMKRQPVAGLSQIEMDNAVAIVTAGKQLNLPRRAFVVAIATALQESRLRNLANPSVSGSMSHPNDGVGYDHDSVGLFQQRPSWGTVNQLMQPQESARRFYAALVQIPGWEQMAVTYAAQTVQRSAFPGAYAQHQSIAEQIVAAIE